jgi:hypothetical protein
LTGDQQFPKFTALSKKKLILLAILLAIAAVGWYLYMQYNRGNKDYKDTTPDFVVSAMELINEYESNDSLAAKKYNGRTIELYGNVKKIEKDEQGFYTVSLADGGNLSSARCSMDTLHKLDAAQLTEGSSVTIRGACTGFNKDEMGLGSDVILNRCAVIQKTD